MVLITALACSAGGYALISAQFHASLDREVAALYEENDLLRFALAQELAFNPLYSQEELAKAAGGISSLQDAEDFLDLGASRLGTSRIIKAVKGLEGSGY